MSRLLESAMQLFREARLAEARSALNRVLEDEPGSGPALEGLGYISAKEGDYAQAADLLDRAVGLLPSNAELSSYAGFVNKAARRPAAALAHYARASALAPAHLPFRAEVAELQMALAMPDAALRSIDQALKLAPKTAALHYNRGRILGMLSRYEDELAAYRSAIALRPDFIDAHVNAGVSLRDMRRFDDALKSFKAAITLRPEHAGARNNRAQTNLLLGRFEHGWREYEWRWKDGGQQQLVPGKPWLGETPIAGKTVLVHAEQGLGDTLQFIRYLSPLKALGAKIVLRVQAALLPLLADFPGPDSIIDERAPLPAFDAHVPLLSLPHALYARLKDIPAAPAYLHADPLKTAQWAARLAEAGIDGARLKVGLVWSGSRIHPDDRNRSTTLAQWLPLLETGCALISLQKDVRDIDREVLSGHPRILDAGSGLSDFSETAALLANLDVVIAVDTSVAHLAGALGVETWLALPFTPDWRWQLDRTDSPWYPSMRLWRQASRGAWSGVVEGIAAALVARSSED